MCDPGEPLLALVGATATGKTAFALELAEELGLEIVSLDSMQVYRGMDIGVAKPTMAERRGVPHHLIDILDLDDPEGMSLAIFSHSGLSPASNGTTMGAA